MDYVANIWELLSHVHHYSGDLEAYDWVEVIPQNMVKYLLKFI